MEQDSLGVMNEAEVGEFMIGMDVADISRRQEAAVSDHLGTLSLEEQKRFYRNKEKNEEK